MDGTTVKISKRNLI